MIPIPLPGLRPNVAANLGGTLPQRPSALGYSSAGTDSDAGRRLPHLEGHHFAVGRRLLDLHLCRLRPGPAKRLVEVARRTGRISWAGRLCHAPWTEFRRDANSLARLRWISTALVMVALVVAGAGLWFDALQFSPSKSSVFTASQFTCAALPSPDLCCGPRSVSRRHSRVRLNSVPRAPRPPWPARCGPWPARAVPPCQQ